MKVSEYIEKAKKELDNMEKLFVDENKKDPKGWPLEMSEEEWGDQELGYRFSLG